MENYRNERLISILKEEVSNLIERYLETPVGSLTTITNIDIGSDSSVARVGVSVIPEKMEEGVIKNLQKFAGEMHFKLIRRMEMRRVPTLQFYLDRGAENAAKLEKIVMEHKEEFDMPKVDKRGE